VAGTVISVPGSAITGVALPVLMYSLTGSAVYTGALTALTAAPYLVIGLLSGAMVDRMHRRTVMVVTDLVCAALLASVPIAAWFGVLTPVQLLVVAAASASVSVWFDAANFGALPTLVSRADLVRANSAIWSASTAGQIAAPSVAGVLIAVMGAPSTVALDAVSFVCSALLARAIIRPLNQDRDPSAERSPHRDQGGLGLPLARAHRPAVHGTGWARRSRAARWQVCSSSTRTGRSRSPRVIRGSVCSSARARSGRCSRRCCCRGSAAGSSRAR
jgi:MFS family permease